jgi:hypothetical protein
MSEVRVARYGLRGVGFVKPIVLIFFYNGTLWVNFRGDFTIFSLDKVGFIIDDVFVDFQGCSG